MKQNEVKARILPQGNHKQFSCKGLQVSEITLHGFFVMDSSPLSKFRQHIPGNSWALVSTGVFSAISVHYIHVHLFTA